MWKCNWVCCEWIKNNSVVPKFTPMGLTIRFLQLKRMHHAALRNADLRGHNTALQLEDSGATKYIFNLQHL